MAWLVNALLEVIKDLVYGAFVLITKWFTGTLTLSTGEFHDIFNKGEHCAAVFVHAETFWWMM